MVCGRWDVYTVGRDETTLSEEAEVKESDMEEGDLYCDPSE